MVPTIEQLRSIEWREQHVNELLEWHPTAVDIKSNVIAFIAHYRAMVQCYRDYCVDEWPEEEAQYIPAHLQEELNMMLVNMMDSIVEEICKG